MVTGRLLIAGSMEQHAMKTLITFLHRESGNTSPMLGGAGRFLNFALIAANVLIVVCVFASVRGLGPSKIATTVSLRSLSDDWFRKDPTNLASNRDRIIELYKGLNEGPWQTAHIVPPLLRFLHTAEEFHNGNLGWQLAGISDPFEPVRGPVEVSVNTAWESIGTAISKALKRERHFRREVTERRRHSNQAPNGMGLLNKIESRIDRLARVFQTWHSLWTR